MSSYVTHTSFLSLSPSAMSSLSGSLLGPGRSLDERKRNVAEKRKEEEEEEESEPHGPRSAQLDKMKTARETQLTSCKVER